MEWPSLCDHRWMGPWGTPNLAGAALAQFLAFLPAVIVGVAWKMPWCKATSALALVGVTTVTVLLVATGSRGGWMAGAVVACWWAWRAVKHQDDRRGIIRSGLALLLGVFLGALAFSHQAQRLGDLADPAHDGSIQCRFALWKAASVMAYDHPVSGVRDFGAAFDMWYVPQRMMSNHWPVAISDPMQLAADRGLVVFAVVATCLTTLIFAGMRAARNASQGVWWHAAGGVLIAACVAATFSNLAWRPWCLVPAMMCGIALLARACRSKDLSSLGIGSGIGMTAAGIVGVVGWWCATGGAVRVASHPPVEVAAPREVPKGVIGIVGGENDSMTALVRGPGRSLVDAGWAVEAVAYEDRAALRGTYTALLVYGGGAGVRISGMDTIPVVLVDPHLGDGGVRGSVTLLVGREDRLPVEAPGSHRLPFPKARCWPKDFGSIARPVLGFLEDTAANR